MPSLDIENSIGLLGMMNEPIMEGQTPTPSLSVYCEDKARLEWNSFSIGSNGSVDINIAVNNGTVLNRVTGVDPSYIMGRLTSNGTVFLVNPNGILFGAGSQVDVAGLVASTMNISNEDFLAGNYQFTSSGKAGYIVNQGNINAHGYEGGGLVAFLGQAVDNQNEIEAIMGTVVMASGNAVTLTFGDYIHVDVTQAVDAGVLGPDGNRMASAIKNSGQILGANRVLMTAKVANGIFDYAINNSGLVQVSDMYSEAGVIYLNAEGAPVINSGTLQGNGVDVTVVNSSFTNTAQGRVIALPLSSDFYFTGYIAVDAFDFLQQGFFSADSVEYISGGTIDITVDNDATFDGGSITQALGSFDAWAGTIRVSSRGGSVFVRANATLDVSTDGFSSGGGDIEIDAFEQIGFYGILSGRAPPGEGDFPYFGQAYLTASSISLAGIFDIFASVISRTDISLAGDLLISNGLSLELLAGQAIYTDDGTYFDWGEPDAGLILNDGDFTIFAERAGEWQTWLTLRAGAGIGSSNHPIKMDVDCLIAEINPESTAGDIYVSQVATEVGDHSLMVSYMHSPAIISLAVCRGIYPEYSESLIEARDLYISAVASIGDTEVPLYTSVDNLQAEVSGWGGIYIINDKTVTVLSIINNGTEGADIYLLSAGDLLIKGNIESQGYYVDLVAAGNIMLSNHADIIAYNPECEVSLNAGGMIGYIIEPEPLDPDLLAYWHMEYSYSGYLEDTTGTYLGSIYGSPSTVTGVLDQALYFNGTTGYVVVPTNFNFGSGSFTLIAWYQGTQSAPYVGLVGATPGMYNGYTMELHNGYLRSWVNGATYDSTRPVNDGQWHQLVMVRDGAAGSLYIDGALDGSFSVPDTSVDTAENFWIGGWGNLNRLTQGAIDEVRVYDAALSGDKISGLFTQTIDPKSGSGTGYGSGKIFAPKLSLTAVEGIDVELGNGIDMGAEFDSTELDAANTGIGAISVVSDANLYIQGVDGTPGIRNAGSSVDLRVVNGGDLILNSHIVMDATDGQISLAADNDLACHGFIDGLKLSNLALIADNDQDGTGSLIMGDLHMPFDASYCTFQGANDFSLSTLWLDNAVRWVLGMGALDIMGVEQESVLLNSIPFGIEVTSTLETGALAVNAPLNARDYIRLASYGDLDVNQDLSASTIELEADADGDGYGILYGYSGDAPLGLYTSDLKLSGAEDFTLGGNYIYGGNENEFMAMVSTVEPLYDLFVNSTTGSILSDGLAETTDVVASGDVYLQAKQTIGVASPLAVRVGGALTVSAYGEAEGVSGSLTGTTASGSLILQNAPGTVYFNNQPIEPPVIVPEPPPQPPQPPQPPSNEDGGDGESPVNEPPLETPESAYILSSDPNSVTAGELSNYLFSSPLGAVYFYHPLTESDLGDIDQFNLDAGSYRLVNGELVLAGGNDRLLRFFDEFDRKNQIK